MMQHEYKTTIEDIGLDIVYDGDIRSFDNKYYKKARCLNRVMLRENYHLKELLFVKEHAKKDVKIPITGAHTLAAWSYNEYYNSKEDFVMELARSEDNLILLGMVQGLYR